MQKLVTNACTLQRIINGLGEPHKSALTNQVNKLYADGGLSDTQLAVAMRQAGIQISHTSINHHRRNVCVCPGR